MLNTNNQTTASRLDAEETKKILTPFAFEIDKSLFGLPLSVPWKRAMALLIDFIFIALLAKTPGEVLALVVAITFFQLGSKKRAEKMGKKRGVRKLLLRYFGAMMLLIIAMSTLPQLYESMTTSSGSVKGSTSSDQLKVEDNSFIDKTLEDKAIKPAKELEDKSTKSEGQALVDEGVKWVKNLINDLGLSFGWAAFYFSVLTAVWNGQTPGKKLLKIRVIQLDGTPLSVWDSFGRYGGYGAGLATGLMGFLQIYWDPNRQAIHDKISSTVVIDLKELADHQPSNSR